MRNNSLLEKIFANWPVKIISVAIAIILYLFYRIGSLEQRFFSIPLITVVSDDFVATEKSSQSIRIKLRGTQDEVFLVYEEDVEAYIDLTDHRSEGQFRAPVFLRKTGTAEHVDVEIKLEPIEVTVTLEKKISKTLDIITEIRGVPAVGFELSDFVLQPSAVEIAGPRSKIEIMQELRTEIVDISGRDANFSVRIPIQSAGSEIEFVSDQVVEFSGVIEQIIILRTFEAVKIEAVNIGDTISILNLPEMGSLRTRGPQLLLETITPDKLTLLVDCSEITEAGTYNLVPVPRIPEGLAVLSFKPTQIDVEAEALSIGEPTPGTLTP